MASCVPVCVCVCVCALMRAGGEHGNLFASVPNNQPTKPPSRFSPPLIWRQALLDEKRVQIAELKSALKNRHERELEVYHCCLLQARGGEGLCG